MTDFSRCDTCQGRIRSFNSWNTNDPQAWLLPCLHVVCALCKLKCQVPLNPQVIVCPLCRTECPKSLLLLIPNSKSCSLRCETPACPEKTVATLKCLSCNELLCTDCGMAHRRVTATSNHVLQPVGDVLADHCRCPIHSNARAVCVCSCGLASCSECLRLGIHGGPQHSVSPISQLAATSSIDEDKIKTSTAREMAQIEASLSLINVRKQMLAERIDSLKKDIGTNVVKACNTIVRRGWDLINTLDFVRKGKEEELNRMREELQWQQMRFNRVNCFVDIVKNYEEPTSVVLTKAYLNNCINMIKAKKLSNEKTLNVLQRPPQVELKFNFDQVLSLASQCGRIYAETLDGTLRGVEIRPHLAPRTVLNVAPFEMNRNNVRAPHVINCAPSTSAQLQMRPGLPPQVPIPPNVPTTRTPLTPGQIRMFQQQQQQFRSVQEAAMRQVAQAVHRVSAVDPRLPLFPAHFRSPTVASLSSRFPMPSGPGFLSSAPPIAFGPDKYVLPNGQIVGVAPRHPVSLPSPIPAATLMEQFNSPLSEPKDLSPVKEPDVNSKQALSQSQDDFAKNVVNNINKERTAIVAPMTINIDESGTTFVDPKKEQNHIASTTTSPAMSVSPALVSQVITADPIAESSEDGTELPNNDENRLCQDTNLVHSQFNLVDIPSPPRILSDEVCPDKELCGILMEEHSDPQLCIEESACSAKESLSNQQSVHLQGSKTALEFNHSTCTTSLSLEQEESRPPETSCDIIQDGLTTENLSSNADLLHQGSDSVQVHDLFANRTNQLQSDSEDQPVPRAISPVKDSVSGEKTSLKMKFCRDALNSTIQLVDVHENVAENAEEESNENTEELSWEDYCYVCQQGCDEKSGSLGCCAKCPRVYHNFCHVPAIREKMETLPDEWECSLCAPSEPLTVDSGLMGSRERLLCAKVLLRCYEDHQNVQPFTHPVPRNVANYYIVIKRPMDFGCIARRLKEKTRDPFPNVTQFIYSMNLVFENCSTFNSPHSEVAKAGREVYQLYIRAVNAFLPCMRNLAWLYITKYSEAKIAAAIQKEGSQRITRARSSENDGDEVSFKRPRRE